MYMTEQKFKFETLQVHAGHTPDSDTNSRVVPIYQTTAYTFNSSEHGANLFKLTEPGNIYVRLQNPTTDVLEARMCALEGGTGALAVASGHAAQFITIATIMKCGDNFVSSPYLYGGSHNQFKVSLGNMGIECRFADGVAPGDFESLIDDKTKALYVETIGNPSYAVPDFDGLSALAKKHDLPLIVDNTFAAGGYFCRPIEYGADILVESATKWIGGHGTSMGGVIVDAGKYNWNNGKYPMLSEPSESYHGMRFTETFGNLAFIVKCRVKGLRDFGPALSPFNSFMILEGMETLSLRAQRQSDNAMALAKYFASHPKTASVDYIGFEDNRWHKNAKKYLRNGYGGMLSVVLKGSKEDTTAFVDNLKLVSHVANVGDNKTLIIQPSATTHSQLNDAELRQAGVEPTSLRISLGIEHIDDIIADFERSFRYVKA